MVEKTPLELTPTEHLSKAAEWLAHAEAAAESAAAVQADSRDLEDVNLRWADVYTRLTTVHLQFASTKTLLDPPPNMSLARLLESDWPRQTSRRKRS